MNASLYRALWGMKHLLDGETHKALSQVRRNEWLSQDELEAMAWEKQKRLVSYAYDNCPYYQQKYKDAGFLSGDLKTPEDFSRLPLLTKNEVQNHVDEMVVQGVDPSRMRKRFTGGSTGTPTMVYHDVLADLSMWSIYLRTVARWGILFGDKTAQVWGLNRQNAGDVYEHQSWWHRTLKNNVMMDAFDMTQEKMQDFGHLMRRFRPHLVIGYASAMTAFARFLEASGGAGFQPRAIWLTAEVTHKFQKELVERVFHAPVYDQYGSNEVLHVASECRYREGLHINTDFRKLEFVDEAGRSLPLGEQGQIVITDLANFAAPLIRYDSADLGSFLSRTCRCGSGLPLMSKVTGRIHDMFVLPDGTQIYGLKFSSFFYNHVDKVSNFQVHQTAKDHAVVRLVPAKTCDRETLSVQLLKSFREYTKGQVTFDVQFVDSIPNEASGKYRFTKSDVSRPTTHTSEGS
ncbi:MAG: phenylacetate--CoA ligase family protein [Chloroflexi bacterium]|nr:phenylacetate--CoA ligase family protein [Chloroflexota bacterium]